MNLDLKGKVAIVTGAGKAFCAGLDIEELKGLLGKTHEQNVADSARLARIFRRIYDYPKPTIAAVNGAAIAGGTGIAFMCDFTLAVPEAKFAYTEVKIGFVPAIVSSILVWQVGHKIARDLLMTGRLFDAAAELLIDMAKAQPVVLVLDDTGFAKKGTHSVGVARQ